MVAKSIFGLVVRLLGLSLAAYGLYQLVNGLLQLADNILFAGFARVWQDRVVFVPPLEYGAVLTIWGVLMLRRADTIVRYTYRPGSGAHCHACGYDLRATPGRCPECGVVPDNA